MFHCCGCLVYSVNDTLKCNSQPCLTLTSLPPHSCLSKIKPLNFLSFDGACLDDAVKNDGKRGKWDKKKKFFFSFLFFLSACGYTFIWLEKLLFYFLESKENVLMLRKARKKEVCVEVVVCLLYTSPSPRD